MTWTLRFYDADGVEVGWVTADPYDWAITHPTPSEYDSLRPSLGGWEDPVDNTAEVEYQDGDAWMDLEPFPGNISPGPKEHLEMIQDAHDPDSVASSTLVDE